MLCFVRIVLIRQNDVHLQCHVFLAQKQYVHSTGFEPAHTNIFELESNPLDQLGHECMGKECRMQCGMQCGMHAPAVNRTRGPTVLTV